MARGIAEWIVSGNKTEWNLLNRMPFSETQPHGYLAL